VQQVNQIRSCKDPLGDGNGKNRIVSKGRFFDKKGKVLCLRPGPFMDRANHIADDRTEHRLPPLEPANAWLFRPDRVATISIACTSAKPGA
jgi:hypothetical protein